jgi:Spy/CpxP family protein refolding chaperone
MRSSYLTRRGFGLAALGAMSAAALPARAQHPGPYMADMHSHYGMFMPRPLGLDLARHMRETGIIAACVGP